ncbi:MAG TPA: dTDP-4-dehydrorhamnose 3,5-epimerase [Polyangia bacterium]|jgi:dTDP-4-dehydrorhamnose 3,5-epimerase
MTSPALPSSEIDGVFHIPLRTFRDDRGYFYESYRRTWLPSAREMIQGNSSFSHAGVLRGLHYHLKQADLWTVPVGVVRAGLFDFRASSPTFGRSELVEMGETNPIGLYIPHGVAHGFYVVKDAFMNYLVDEYYDNSDELGIRWDDPALKLDWGATAPVISRRDQENPLASAVPTDRRPR